MKLPFSATLIAILILIVLGGAKRSWGFVTSEDEQFRADIFEAKARARDFKQTIERIDRAQRELEASGKERAWERIDAAEETESVRRNHVRERNARPSEQAQRDRWEREDEALQRRRDEAMERNRSNYVKKRDEVRRVIEREAYLDESREYGL